MFRLDIDSTLNELEERERREAGAPYGRPSTRLSRARLRLRTEFGHWRHYTLPAFGRRIRQLPTHMLSIMRRLGYLMLKGVMLTLCWACVSAFTYMLFEDSFSQPAGLLSGGEDMAQMFAVAAGLFITAAMYVVYRIAKPCFEEQGSR